MAILNFFRKKDEPIEYRIKKAQDGDSLERENIISEYLPFIIKAITKITHKYVETENDEEYSIALEAFNESMDKYDPTRGSFISFAQLIIRSRIIDHLRKPTHQTIPIDAEDKNCIDPGRIASNEDFVGRLELSNEIDIFKNRLLEFGITLSQLVDEAPRRSDARHNSMKIARLILDNDSLKDEFYRKKAVPAAKIAGMLNISGKTVQRNKKLIIAAVIALDSELEDIREYVLLAERRISLDTQRNRNGYSKESCNSDE